MPEPAYRAYKFRLYPTVSQTRTIENSLERCRELYNAALEERREAYRVAQKAISYFDQQNELPEMKDLRPEFKKINSQVLQNVVRRVGFTYDAFFRRIKQRLRTSPPRFQSAKRYNSFTYPMVLKGALGQRRIYLPAIGKVRWKLWKSIDDIGRVKTLTVRREPDGYYAILSCEIAPQKHLPSNKRSVGLDFGVTQLVTTNSGEVLGDIAPLKRAEIALRDSQRRKDHRVLGSKRRVRACRIVARRHQHLARSRKNQLDCISRKIVASYGTICVEDLNVVGMLQMGKHDASGRSFRRNKHHASWAMLRKMLTYKAEEAGRRLIAVSAYGTSQECSACGTVVHKSLRMRTHHCDCGLVIDRDTNAARNILQRGLQLLRREVVIKPRRPVKTKLYGHG